MWRAAPGFDDADTVRDAIRAVGAYLVGAIRMEIAKQRPNAPAD